MTQCNSLPGPPGAKGTMNLPMLTRLDLRARTDLRAALVPPAADADADDALDVVREIIADVRKRGDDALRDLTERFDGCRIDELRVPPEELRAALDHASPEFRAALEYASGEIRAYHEAQVEADVEVDRNGVTIRAVTRAVERAGLYVPGGRANYPSTVLMTAIPAQVAGVAEIALCVPPDSSGAVPAATLAAAALVGVTEVYRVGGAQAIAALAYGTESIPAVDVIVGPGNRFVALAKREVAGTVGIESFAGPSEVVVVADGSVPAEYVAADLLAQAEHGPGGSAVLVTWIESVADAVDAALEAQIAADRRRAPELEATVAEVGRAVLVDGPDAAIAAVDVIAPEHLELLCADARALSGRVRNAGAVFVGPWAPAAVGDYVAGVNHVLPTARTARFASALRVASFTKHIHIVELTEAALARVQPHVEAMAAVEGLDAHARSVALRAAAPSEGGGR
jgi:histidinol dehydrogenase